MVGRKEIIHAGHQDEKKSRLDETGKVHPFYAWRPLKESAGQTAFFNSEAKLQAFVGGNKIGKTTSLHQKVRCAVLNEDPSRPGYRFPIDPENKFPFNVWVTCPPEFVRKEVDQINRGFPRSVKRRIFLSGGRERIEFEPTERRPHGATIYVKSRQKPLEDFQYDICHIVAFDEQPPPEVWTECQQRLLMTGGWTLIALTPWPCTTWFYDVMKGGDEKFQNLLAGNFAWFTASQFENPHIPQADIELRAERMSEVEYEVRVEGKLRLMQGGAFFNIESLQKQREMFQRDPTHALDFDSDPKGKLTAWTPKSRGWRVFELPKVGEFFVMAGDPSAGVGGDQAVGQIVNAFTGEQVAVYSDKWTNPFDFGVELALAGRFYNNALIQPEINYEGAAVLESLRQMAYPNIATRKTYGGRKERFEDSQGWLTGKHNKWAGCNNLNAALERGADRKIGGIIIHDELTLDEMRNFWNLPEDDRRPGTHGIAAINGHDDHVMSLMIAFNTLDQSPVQQLARNVEIVKGDAEKDIAAAYAALGKKPSMRGVNALAQGFSLTPRGV